MSKHTPGPWSMSGPMGKDHLSGREPWFWISAETTLHLQVMACADGYVRGENEANARLISAAPDLLEALRTAIQMLVEWQMDYPESVGDNEAALMKAARAAIAKATGEQT
jgi:hypothetical protein